MNLVSGASPLWSPRALLQAWFLKPVLNWANVSSRTELEVSGEAIFGVQKASLSMFWEHSPYSTIIASDGLRAELSCG